MKPENDCVYTNHLFAKRIITYFSSQFKETDTFFDPCAGSDGYCIKDKTKQGKAFYRYLPEPKQYAELIEGIDCTSNTNYFNWSFSNPPFSAKAYRKVAKHCAKYSDNVVFLCRLDVSIGTYARIRDFNDENHFLKEIIQVKYKDAGFAPRGFVLGVFHWQKNYKGDTKWTNWI